MLIVFITIIAVTAATPNKLAFIRNDSICETSVCTQEASRMLKKINLEIDPCNDFYQFACGKFVNETIINDGEEMTSTFLLTSEKLNEKLRHSITEIKEDDIPIFQSIKLYYQSCMDTEKIEKSIQNYLVEVLQKISWNETWEKFVPEADKMGYSSSYFFMSLSVDLIEMRSYTVTINFPNLLHIPEELAGSIYKDESQVRIYWKYLTDILNAIGFDVENNITNLLDLLVFEHELKKLSTIKKGKEFEKRRTIRYLEKNYPNISWFEYINGILAPDGHIKRLEPMTIANENYIEAFHSLISKTSRNVILTYGAWVIIKSAITNTGIGRWHAIDSFSVFQPFYFGEQTPPRQVRCIEEIKDSFPIASAALYVRRHFNENMKTKAYDIFKNMRINFFNMIQQVEWMDNTTKNAAKKTLNELGVGIGFPDQLLDDNIINEYYKNLKVYPENYLKSRNSLDHFNIKQNLLKLRMSMKDFEESTWQSHNKVFDVNAYYYPTVNFILLESGILQEEFFNDFRPNYVNYGGIGWLIGHELIHAFDDDKYNYETQGNLVNWTTREEYKKKIKCIIEQYNKYTVQQVNLKLNGYKTRNENSADIGGLKMAYYAYNEWAKQNDPEPYLPGLNYTPQQMFWISAATSRCEKYTPQYLEIVVLTETHSPQEFCVTGSMSNLPEFSKDFQCPLGSRMNPVKKCSVW